MTLTAPAIRDLLKTRQHLRRAGYPPFHPAIVTIQGIVSEYRERIGMPTYLSEMLGPLAALPVAAVRFYGPEGEAMEFEGNERVIDFLRVAECHNWPWVVSSLIGERYL